MRVPTQYRAARPFDHVLLLMFENQYRGYVLANPYMRCLAKQGRQVGNYFGVMHPSQTNYIASIAGSLCNVTSDNRPPVLDDLTIVDLIEEAPGRLRWRAYMESYVPAAQPWTPDFSPQDAPPYFVKHNPFAAFSSVLRDERRWRRIDNEAALFADILSGDFPQYAWFTPNIWNDGHWIDGTEEECSPRAPGLVDQSAACWKVLRPAAVPWSWSLLPPRTMVVVTFDESDFEADYLPDQGSPYDGPNQIYTLLLGDCIEPGLEDHEGYNHYSLLRTIEQNFGLGHLGRNDAGSNWFQFLWNASSSGVGPRRHRSVSGLGPTHPSPRRSTPARSSSPPRATTARCSFASV